MDIEKTMEFILEQLAHVVVLQAKAEERLTLTTEVHDREIAEIRKIAERTRADLNRAVRLGVQEARNARLRDQALDEKMTQLASSQLLTEEKLQALIDRMGRGGNGHA